MPVRNCARILGIRLTSDMFIQGDNTKWSIGKQVHFILESVREVSRNRNGTVLRKRDVTVFNGLQLQNVRKLISTPETRGKRMMFEFFRKRKEILRGD